MRHQATTTRAMAAAADRHRAADVALAVAVVERAVDGRLRAGGATRTTRMSKVRHLAATPR